MAQRTTRYSEEGQAGEGGGTEVVTGYPGKRSLTASIQRKVGASLASAPADASAPAAASAPSPDPCWFATGGPSPAHAPDPITPTGMSASVQAKMERSFASDFSGVRIHQESSLATGLGALAAAKGDDVHFAPGQYQPETAAGQAVLGHELAHVVQQRAGRVATAQPKADPSAGGVTLNVDHALEHEADVAGQRAAAGELATVATSGGGERGAVIQPMFGFEIEMLVLVDDGGRPIPEKTPLGTVGAHLLLDVDHGGAVAARVPTNGYQAPVPGNGADIADQPAVPGVMIAPAESVNYDLPAGGEARMRQAGAGGDLRPALVGMVKATWDAATAGAQFARGGANGLDNAALTQLDTLLPQYAYKHRNWEIVTATARLDAILAQIAAWRAANPTPGALDAAGIAARGVVDAALQVIFLEATAHRVFWAANPALPAGMRREFSVPDGGGAGGMTAFAPDHPSPGMGKDEYASILEIVTRPYSPETPDGRANILAAMNAAIAFATALEGGGGLTNRRRLDTIAGVAGASPTVHFGNASQPAQTTAGSFQCTGAIDLAQFPSFVLSMTAPLPVEHGDEDPDVLTNDRFNLKHQSDTEDDEGGTVRAELPAAVANATTAVNHIKGLGAGGPDMVNLRGLVTLICQYLRMGRHHDNGQGGPPALNKNIVPFLSRTDLTIIFKRQVPPEEHAWLNGTPVGAGETRLTTLIAQILAASGRTPNTRLYNNAAQTNPYGNWGVTCADFVNNVFTQDADGVTDALGDSFKAMPPESVDPLGARDATDSAYGGGAAGGAAAHREGFVFEMRNMAKREFGNNRFPKGEWLKLAEQEVAIAKTLNERTEASATTDQRVHHRGFGAAGHANRLAVTATPKPAW